MNQNHYPSLELCKKLTEARFPKTEKCFNDNEIRNDFDYTRDAEYNVCPSIAELLDEMPERIKWWEFQMWKKECWYFKDDATDNVHYPVIVFNKRSLPNALAEMWLWLKENNYLK